MRSTNQKIQDLCFTGQQDVQEESQCGSVNEIGPHNFIRSDTMRRCGFVGVGMVLLEEVCHCMVSFEVSYVQDITECLSQVSVSCKIKDSQPLLQYHVCMHVVMFPVMMTRD